MDCPLFPCLWARSSLPLILFKATNSMRSVWRSSRTSGSAAPVWTEKSVGGKCTGMIGLRSQYHVYSPSAIVHKVSTSVVKETMSPSEDFEFTMSQPHKFTMSQRKASSSWQPGVHLYWLWENLHHLKGQWYPPRLVELVLESQLWPLQEGPTCRTKCPVEPDIGLSS